jgi:membrane-bound ClpP family serine protease
VTTVAFVNRRAISAGALISLAARHIAMTDGGTIGAATPVQIGGPGGEAKPVEEKSVSYVRKEFRATADSRKRPPLIAEAMVDADVEIPGTDREGKLLTLTTDEALEHGVADFRAAASRSARAARPRRMPRSALTAELGGAVRPAPHASRSSPRSCSRRRCSAS